MNLFRLRVVSKPCVWPSDLGDGLIIINHTLQTGSDFFIFVWPFLSLSHGQGRADVRANGDACRFHDGTSLLRV